MLTRYPEKRPHWTLPEHALLFADYDADMRNLYQEYFRATGYHVRTVEDGHQAVRSLCYGPVDALITELNMPRVDGVLLIEVVRLLYPALPVIIVSSEIESDQIPAAIPGATAALRKPVALARLAHLICATVQQSRPLADGALGA